MLTWRVGPSWNEPDGQCGRNLTVGILCDTPSFLAYYDATAAGLMLADEGLFYGGPASDGAKKFLYALVQHCLNGTNAITGERGCGKSTTIELMKRSFDPEAGNGTITVNGRPMREWNVRSFRQKIAVVAQKLNFFVGTIRDRRRRSEGVGRVQLF